MNKAKTNQLVINQANHSAGDAISLGNNVLSYTVKCHPQSPSNVFVGLSEDASPGNLLEPGDSVTISPTQTGYYLADDLYIQFDPDSGSNLGIALVIVVRDLKEEAC